MHEESKQSTNPSSWSREERIFFISDQMDFSFTKSSTEAEMAFFNEVLSISSNSEIQEGFILGFSQTQMNNLPANNHISKEEIRSLLYPMIRPIELAESLYGKSIFNLSAEEESEVREVIKRENVLPVNVSLKSTMSCNSYDFPLSAQSTSSSGGYSAISVFYTSTPNNPNDCDYNVAFYTNGNLYPVNGKIGLYVTNLTLSTIMRAAWGTNYQDVHLRQTSGGGYTHVILGNGLDDYAWMFSVSMSTLLKNNIKIKQL
ncbi:hypothetical protein HC823_00235 [Candidatus Gracilibacteria bacterium]|nr:hypothetical protein [Candidatus Gracilibacteria bacterium]